MKDQHTKIKGYRDLTQAEIDLMNRVKEHGVATQALLAEVSAVNAAHADQGLVAGAEAHRWVAIAKTDYQTAQMALTRAVAKPGFF